MDEGSNGLNNTTSGFRRETVSLRRNSILSGLGTPQILAEDNMSNMSKAIKGTMQHFSMPTSPTLIKNTFLGTKPLGTFTPNSFWVRAAATASNSSRVKKNLKGDTTEKSPDALSPKI